MFRATEIAMKKASSTYWRKPISKERIFKPCLCWSNEPEHKKKFQRAVAERDEAAASSEYNNMNSEQTKQTYQSS